MSGFVKLYGTILDSSIWGEPLSVRIVWISLLAMADKDGVVAASSDGIARRANVSLKQTDAALEVLSSPDPRSKSADYEGRRVERIDRGYLILNYAAYRELRTEKQIADAERQQRHRAQRDMSHVSQTVATDADVDAKAKANTETESSSDDARFLFNEIATALRLPQRQLRSWHGMLTGMTAGLGSPGMRAVSWQTLHEAAIELSTQDGDFTANRFKAFVRKVLERQTRTTRPSDKASRGAAALGEWLNESEITDAEVVDG